jgi:hypothetical protein
MHDDHDILLTRQDPHIISCRTLQVIITREMLLVAGIIRSSRSVGATWYKPN